MNSDLLKIGEEYYRKDDLAYEEDKPIEMTSFEKKIFLNGSDVPDKQESNPWSINIEPTEEYKDYKKAHPVEDVPILNKQLHDNGCTSSFEYSNTLANLSYIIADIVAGDEKARDRPEFTALNFPAIKAAIDWLIRTNQMTNTGKIDLLQNAWMLNFKVRPPTPTEFISERYIGDQANSLYPWAKDVFADYFDPLKPYRTLILTQCIGSGKAQPYSSKVAIDEEVIIDFDFENDNILSFNKNDFILTQKGFEQAKNVVVDFPEHTNLIIMSIYDCRKIKEFKFAFETESYNDLISFFKNLPKDFLKNKNIRYHTHHIIPRSEGGGESKDNKVDLPIYFHIKAHYLRGMEMERIGNKNFAYKNYKAVACAIDRNIYIPKDYKIFLKELDIVIASLQKKQTFDKKTVYVYNGKKYKRILKDEIGDYIKEGWELKGPPKGNSNKVFVNKDCKNYYIPKNELEDYLKNGYKKGMYKTEKMINKNCVSYSTLNTKWMHKGEIRKCINVDKVEEYLKQGWILGSGVKNTGGPKGTPHKKQGLHWWTNGKTNVCSVNCPGNDFYRGRVYENKQKKESCL